MAHRDPELHTMTGLGQRAFVTLVFSDLCEYTRLSEALDPEEVDAIRSQLDDIAAEVVRQHNGFVTQIYGDGRLCVFGFPDPTEDDVRHSLDAALDLHAAVRDAQWLFLPRGFQLRLHSGVHRGLVFVRTGTELHGRFQLTGDTVNTAARLCGVAKRDEILVSATTLSGCEEYYETVARPAISLRGKSAPQRVVQVLARTTVRTRFEARTRRGLTKFVNRTTVLAAASLSRPTGRGRLLVIHGPPGIGKTRLLAELAARASEQGINVLGGTCENYGKLVPLEPFSQILRQLFMRLTETDELKPEDVEAQCAQLGADVMAHTTTFLVLMHLLAAEAEELTALTVADALKALIASVSAKRALALFLDDWQWADGASRAVLSQLRETALACGVNIVLSARSSELTDTMLQPDDVIPLSPLSEPDCANMMAYLRSDAFSPQIGALVLQRAGGNPLFLEELCLALPSTPDDERAAQSVEIPATVQGVIQTRIAALPEGERSLLRLASVIGLEFSAAMLAELSETELPKVRKQLAVLSAEDLIYASDAASHYHFKHGLTREVVYESVLFGERKQLHARVAALIERTGSDTMQTAEALAHHYRNSGDLERAARYAESAGDQAMAVSALDRASAHYLAAMHALDAMPVSPDTRRRWLAISAKWGLPFAFSPVSSQLDVLHTADRYAHELGDVEAQGRLWHWLGWAYYGLGNYVQSIAHFKACEELAARISDTRLLNQAQACLGQSQAAAGQYPAALENLARSTDSKRAQAGAKQSAQSSAARIPPGYLYAVACTALVYADQGDFARSDETFEAAFSRVRGSHHAIEGSMLALRCIALLWREHFEEALTASELALANARMVNSAFNFVACSCYAAYASWELTRTQQSRERMQATIDWIEAHHLELYASCDYSWFAHVLLESGEPARARAYAERALHRAQQGDPMGEAAAYRVLARLGATDATAAADVARCLDRAQQAGDRRGSGHERVKTQLLRAELARERGDRAGAVYWAEQCQALAQELGMHRAVTRAQTLLRTCA